MEGVRYLGFAAAGIAAVIAARELFDAPWLATPILLLLAVALLASAITRG